MKLGTAGRWAAALAIAAVPLAAGCGSDESPNATAQTTSALCGASEECARAAPCGCAGMDDGCNCDECQQAGACHQSDILCAPASDDDCHHPNGACEVYGFCHFVTSDGVPRCRALGDDDCRPSALCAEWGDCVFAPDIQQCAAGSADDCAASDACRELGCCSLVGGECVRNDGTCPYKCCGDKLC